MTAQQITHEQPICRELRDRTIAGRLEDLCVVLDGNAA
jgi:hypothetical protein